MRKTRQGKIVRVTDRGKVVAELRPPEPQNEHQRGLLRRYPGLAERMPAALEGITSAELLDQDRGER